MATTKKKDKTEPKFTKAEILNAKKPLGDVDVFFVVLEDDKMYTIEEAKKLEKEFLKRRLK